MRQRIKELFNTWRSPIQLEFSMLIKLKENELDKLVAQNNEAIERSIKSISYTLKVLETLEGKVAKDD